MLALLGFVGIAMSSFVVIGHRDPAEDDADTSATDHVHDAGTSDGTGTETDLLSMVSGNMHAGMSGNATDDEATAIEPAKLSDGLPAQEMQEDVSATLIGADGAGSIVVLDDVDPAFPDAAEDDYGDDLLPNAPPPAESAAATTERWGTADDDIIDGDATHDLVDGGDGNDYVTGNLGDDSLTGGLGDDHLVGGSGNDFLSGDDGDDTLEGGWDDDTLIGGIGRDLLNGGGGNDLMDGRDADDGFDYLNGGAGDDVLLAGRGDHLNGGTGADTFSILSDGDNVIDDFDPANDTLEITYTGEAPLLTATGSDDGLIVMADDVVVARLTGITALDLSTVVLTAA